MRMKFFPFLLVLLIVSSCGRKDRFSIDTSENRTDVKIQRFDSALILLDTLNATASVKEIYKAYPVFFRQFITAVDTVQPADTLKVARNLRNFITYPEVRKINRRVMEVFADVSDIEKEISEAYTYLNHYFPKLPKPDVWFFVSGMSRQIITDERMESIGIGSDFYLGADYEPYKSLVYDYMLQNMNRRNLSVDLISTLLFNYFRFDSKQNRLIDNMLHRGKVMFMLAVFMPERPLNDIIGYNTTQWNWAVKNEKEIWNTVVSQKDLFSSDLQLIRKYLNDAPFTSPVSQESPGRLGTWIGMRIVESYMNKNKEVTLQQLMQINDYQKLMEESGYKP